jgi:dipeptidyl aminopeptidase/acylaminoacyl peptidase
LKTGKCRPLATNDIDITFTHWRDNKRLLVAGVRKLESVVADLVVSSGKVNERWVSKTLCCTNFYYPAAAAVPGTQNHCVVSAVGFRQAQEIQYATGTNAKVLISFAHRGSAAIVRKLRAVEPYHWKAPDGTEIQGWLMRGSDKRPSPLVMEIHGGPVWRWQPSFLARSAYHVMLSERGYALFWPNPRGSSGRGQDFARMVVGDMGGADASDLLSGLNQLEAAGIADSRRIGVMGASYGGFMASWLITQDQRFAAAVIVAPITDWVSLHLTSSVGHWDALFQASVYTDLKGNYFRHSPIMQAKKVKTPALVICGAMDHCTPPSQAQEFHAALRQNNVKSVLVTYPMEGHGVQTFPAKVDYSARIVDWFERHMTGR